MENSQVFLFYLAAALCAVLIVAPRTEAARAFFVFGDSLVDNGNNNYLATTARADAPPYGIDYPTHRATGRFSNGFNLPDLISQEIGSESTLPYLSPQLNGEKLLVGANFASAGIGILNDTGLQFINIIRIGQQLAYFKQYQERVSAIIGEEGAQRLVSKALYLITLGGNDFINNYFLVSFSSRSQQYTLEEYVPFIISEYRQILLRLYNLGARRVIVTGTGPLGCAPAELAQHSVNGECVAGLQRASALFNPSLLQMVNGINSELGSPIFIASNPQESTLNFISSPQSYGFVTSKVACCGQGPYNGIGQCTGNSNLCSNRDAYVFFDPFHPSERANKIIVQGIMVGDSKHMHPMNLSTIMALDSMT